ncbi:condensation domain-containing protein [Streptacidiphilus griseoplanus]|uniref:condensation domain-containing protein n=1 Tax=Peterkaempfera griseoplana TaxID=66896 RepID=UPI0006E20167|nr:condensation domain-containing protein [Peterkaempfera griseoplana]
MTEVRFERLRELVSHHYSEALGFAPSSPFFTFWELGGTSLQLAALVSRIRKETGIMAPMSRLFQDTSMDGITATLHDCAIAERTALPTSWVPSLVRNCVLRQRLSPQDTASNCVMLWQIDGHIDRTALLRSLRDLGAQHDALHSSFSIRGESKLARDVSGTEPVVLSATSREQALQQILDVLDAPLDPTSGLVGRGVVVGLGTSTTLVGLVAHYAAFDGHSESVVAHDLAKLYEHHASGRPLSPAPADRIPLRAAYGMLAATRTFPSFGEQQAKAGAYFEALPDLPMEPGDAAGPDEATALALRVETPDGHRLRKRATELGVSYFGLLATAYARTLQTCLGVSDVVFGVPVNRRMGLPLARTVGNFVAMVPVRLRLVQAVPFRMVLPAAQSQIAAALEFIDLEFEDVAKLIPRANKGRAYRHVFALQNNPAPVLEVPAARTRFLRQAYSHLANDTMLEVWPAGTGYADSGDTVVLSYRPSVVSEKAADNVLKVFLSQLAEALES